WADPSTLSNTSYPIYANLCFKSVFGFRFENINLKHFSIIFIDDQKKGGMGEALRLVKSVRRFIRLQPLRMNCLRQAQMLDALSLRWLLSKKAVKQGKTQ
ncbi:hypothetical protein EBS40_09205, partial [bacterium]|nr:hypothetical protein [bacterium]